MTIIFLLPINHNYSFQKILNKCHEIIRYLEVSVKLNFTGYIHTNVEYDFGKGTIIEFTIGKTNKIPSFV